MGAPEAKNELFAAADERGVLVIEFVGDALGAGLCGDEFHFADEIAAPGLVDAGDEVVGHVLELLLPGFGIGGDFQVALLAADGPRARGKGLADDLRPGTGEPRERGFGAVKLADRAAQDVACLLHVVGAPGTST